MSKNTGYVVGVLLVCVALIVGIMLYAFLPNSEEGSLKDNNKLEGDIILDDTDYSSLILEDTGTVADIDCVDFGFDGVNALRISMSETDFDALFLNDKYEIKIYLEFEDGTQYILENRLDYKLFHVNGNVAALYELPQDFVLPNDYANYFFTAKVIMYDNGSQILESNVLGDGDCYLYLTYSAADSCYYMSILGLKIS